MPNEKDNQKLMKEAKQTIERLPREEANKVREEANRRIEKLNKRIEETNKQIEEIRQARQKRHQKDDRER